MGRVGVDDGRPVALQADDGAVRSGCDCDLFALASRQAWGLDPRPRVCRSQTARAPSQVVERKETMTSRDAILHRIRTRCPGRAGHGAPASPRSLAARKPGPADNGRPILPRN